jgi:5-methylcytosine-specific restriction endonuclease McrBC GTP-binding regulatory subunit McrB
MTEIKALPEFTLTVGNKKATARLRDDQFVVLAGSAAKGQSVASFETHSYGPLRATLLKNGALMKTDLGDLIYQQDVPFRSASAAAAVTLGRAANGRKEWMVTQEGNLSVSHGEWLEANKAMLPAGLVQRELEPIEADWPPFFMEMASRLLEYEDRQDELVRILREVGISVGTDDNEPLVVMDPFTFVCNIKKYEDQKKISQFLVGIRERLHLTSPVPESMAGFSITHLTSARFFQPRSVRQAQDLADLWALAHQAVSGTLNDLTFQAVLQKKGVGLAKLTQCLYGLNPQMFLPLNKTVTTYIEQRGVRGANQVGNVAELDVVLNAARALSPDFISLAQAAVLAERQQVATLTDLHFPFDRFREDAAQYASDRVKGNLVLDRKYAPLLLELLDGNHTNLKPGRSPYSGREQLAVKVGLGGGTKLPGGTFGRALMFADDSGFEYVSFPAGLTLEIGLLDGRGDAVRQALQDDGIRAQFRNALLTPLPTEAPATLTLNTDFGALKLLPLRTAQADEIDATIATYAQGFGKNRQLQVGLTLSPAEMESSEFLPLLESGLSYLDDLMGILDTLSRTTEPARQEPALIEVPGKPDEAISVLFTPVPGVPLNQILYGPPGTGKTYRVVDEALSVLDPAFLKAHPGAEGRAARKGRYDQLAQEGQISFVTFHQSFGYEDFIEGIKPVMHGGNLSYQLQDGVFLQAARAAGGVLAGAEGEEAKATSTILTDEVRPDAQVWRMYIDGTAPVSQVRDRSVQRGELRMDSNKNPPRDLTHLGVEELSGRQLLFKDSMRRGDLVLLATGADRIGAVGIVTGEYRFDTYSEPVFALDYAHTRSVRWLDTGLNLSATATMGKPFSATTLQRVADVTPTQALRQLNLQQEPSASPGVGMRPHVLIIDEINRGNVSKIFGELITLLEAGKRAGSREALTATLPLSRRAFSVPQSLYVIGTMNTADRSLTLLDAALRRRFVFRPVWPEPEVLPVIEIGGDALDLRKFLYVINERIERLLSREQVVGHAYLLGLPATLEGVASALRERILPLLEEYFFEDWGKIRTVLADDAKDEAQQFVQMYKTGGELRYRVNEAAFGEIEAFTQVYSRTAEADFPFSS